MRPPLNVLITIVWLTCFFQHRHTTGANILFTRPYGNQKVTYQDALTRCPDTLPDDQTAHDELVMFMERFRIWQIWLGWRRSKHPWTWVTGQAVASPLHLDDRDEHDCGVMEHDGRLEARPCHHTLPVICQFAGVPCSQTYAAAYCASSNKTTFLVAPGLQGWFHARAFCRHLAGDLVTIQNGKDLTLAKGLVKKLPGWPFWIGARRNQWKILGAKTELNDMITNQWEADQPGAGDCVVIHRTGGRGFWRSANCGSVNYVICTSENYKDEVIMLPKQNNTENGLVDISIYSGTKKKNLTLHQLCERENLEPITPDELFNSMNKIAHNMKVTRTKTAWLPWKRHTLLNWTWLRGDIYSGKMVEDRAFLCASPDHVFGPSSMYVVPCHAKDIGYTCLFDDGKPCWQRHHAYNCFPLESRTLVVGYMVQSWYIASALCSALGGQLAQLPEQWMIKALLDFNKKQRTLQTTNFFFVGIQKSVWHTDAKDPLTRQNLWAIGNPLLNGTCSIMHLEGDNLLWRSADCTDTHALVCRAPPIDTTATTLESSSIHGGGKNVSHQKDQSPQKPSPFLTSGLIVLVVILVASGLLAAYCLKRRNMKRKKRLGGQGHSSNVQGANEPDEDVQLIPEQSPTKTRKYSGDLHPERHNALLNNTKVLMENILLQSADLLETLMNNKVLSKANKDFIEEKHGESEQIECLIHIMTKKNNECFERFCDSLWATEQKNIVTKYLSSTVDFDYARQKVINYIEREFTNLNMYTAEGESRLVPMDKIYVNVTWERFKESQKNEGTQNTGELAILRSHFDVFDLMQKHGDTRTAISGDAGSGKTLFMKHIAKEWLNAHRNHTSEKSPLKSYIILIPIILRLIQSGMELVDVIKDQIPSISFLEAYSICKAMSVQQSKVLVIFDGYDELVAKSSIDPILMKDKYAEVSVVVTARPHGITLLRSLGKDSFEQLLYIMGFNNEQIREYITLFFGLPGETVEKGLNLIKEVLAKETYLSEMARVPIQLQIICLVWSVKEKLGDNIADLYENFVECLDFHMKRKREYDYDNTKIILGLCKLANSWTNSGCLKKIFAHEKLYKDFPNLSEDMVKFGFLVKYHPATYLHTSYWSFSHLTLQEYFLARGFCQHAFKEDDIMKRLSSVSQLERHEIVLKFICGMNPLIGNKILQAVFNKTTAKEECERLLDLTQKLIPEYKSKDEINLPLPRYVEFDETDTSIKRDTLIILSRTDRRPEHQNMRHLSLSADAVKYLSEIPHAFDISYVHTLELQAGDEQPNDVGYLYILTNAKRIRELEISNINENFPGHVLRNVASKLLSHMKLHGKFVIGKATEYLDNRRDLEVLCLEETEEIVETEMQKLCKKLKTCTQVHWTVSFLNPALLFLQSTTKITVRKLTKESLAMFLGRIKESNHGRLDITELNIQHVTDDDTKEHGGNEMMLGHLLCFLPQLQRLSLSKEYIYPMNLERLVHILNERNMTLCLHCLSLIRIDLRGVGVALGQLVSRCPQLHTLELCVSWLTEKEMVQMKENMPGSTSITRLALAWNDYLRGGEPALCDLLLCTPHLQELDLWYCHLNVLALLRAASSDTLINLRILDLGYNPDEQLQVGYSLLSMANLEALSVAGSDCTSVSALEPLINNLPPTLTHLNMCCNNFGAKVVEVTKHKKNLAQLQRFNIGMVYQKDEVQAIREELQQLNPDMRVYCDGEERLYHMYKDIRTHKECRA